MSYNTLQLFKMRCARRGKPLRLATWAEATRFEREIKTGLRDSMGRVTPLGRRGKTFARAADMSCSR